MTEVLSLTTDLESLSFEYSFLAKSQYKRTNQHSLRYFRPLRLSLNALWRKLDWIRLGVSQCKKVKYKESFCKLPASAWSPSTCICVGPLPDKCMNDTLGHEQILINAHFEFSSSWGGKDIEIRQEIKDNVWLQKSLTALLRHKLHVVVRRRKEQGVCGLMWRKC